MLTIVNLNNKKPISIRDFVALMLVIGVFAIFELKIHDLSTSIDLLTSTPISLDWRNLPHYAILTILRMSFAVLFSLFIAITFATMAAKSKHLEKIIIPIVDILQSIPILGFLSFTITFFMSLYPGNRLGIELATIFVIFTSQVWNMLLSFYQSLKNIPNDLKEVAQINHLSSFDKFFSLELPFALPGLIWNMMLSMSAGWFFVVASEAITVGNITFTLPGIGSYIALAIKMMDMHAVFYAIITMAIVIFLYDFLLFRPLVAWAEKFRFGDVVSKNHPQSFIFNLFRDNYFTALLTKPISKLFDFCLDLSYYQDNWWNKFRIVNKALKLIIAIFWYLIISIICLYGAIETYYFLESIDSIPELLHIAKLTFYTSIRVFTLIIASLIIWVPIGIYIGLNPKLTSYSQPIIQFLSAFPVNLIFPIIVVAIKYFDLNPNIWLTILMMIGTQWYILFNVIAGTSMFPGDLSEVCSNFTIKRSLWWFRVMIPAISPYIVTGIITAFGGAWNSSIVAEIVNWGNDTFIAQGVGSYIAIATTTGNLQKVALGIIFLALVVTVINRLIWHPLYLYTEQLTKAN